MPDRITCISSFFLPYFLTWCKTQIVIFILSFWFKLTDLYLASMKKLGDINYLCSVLSLWTIANHLNYWASPGGFLAVLILFWLLIEGYIFFMGPHLLPPILFVPPYCSIGTIQCLNASQIMTQLELPCVLLLSTPNRPPQIAYQMQMSDSHAVGRALCPGRE